MPTSRGPPPSPASPGAAPSSATSSSTRRPGRSARAPSRVRRAGVLERVRQRLLHDPVGGEVDAGRQRSRRRPRREARPAGRRPDARRRARRGCASAGLRRERRARSSAARSTPSSRRISVERLARRSARSRRTPSLGLVGRRATDAARRRACTTITLTACATTSCSSRAIRGALLGHGRGARPARGRGRAARRAARARPPARAGGRSPGPPHTAARERGEEDHPADAEPVAVGERDHGSDEQRQAGRGPAPNGGPVLRPNTRRRSAPRPGSTRHRRSRSLRAVGSARGCRGRAPGPRVRRCGAEKEPFPSARRRRPARPARRRAVPEHPDLDLRHDRDRRAEQGTSEVGMGGTRIDATVHPAQDAASPPHGRIAAVLSAARRTRG